MKLLFFNFILHLLLFTSLFGQKKIIDHHAYNQWKKTSNIQISKNGKIVTFETYPHEGDGSLYVFHNNNIDTFLLGKSAKVSDDESFVVFEVIPSFDTLRKCKIDDLSQKNWPKDSLFIYYPFKDSLIKLEVDGSWKVGESSSNIAFFQKSKNKKEKKLFKKIRKKKKQIISYGKNLQLKIDSDIYLEKHVIDFNWSQKGKQIALIKHREINGNDYYKLFLKQVDSAMITIYESSVYTNLTLPIWNKKQDRILFMASSESNDETEMNLMSYNIISKELNTIGDLEIPDFDSSLCISRAVDPEFIENTNYAFLGVTQREKKDQDTLLESEKPQLDIWHYLDKEIQPVQLLNAMDNKKDVHYYLFDTDSNTLTKLSNDTLKIVKNSKIKSDFILGYSNESYILQSQWNWPMLNDFYLIDIKSGDNTLLKKGVVYPYGLSPQGKYFTYFDHHAKQHYLINTSTKEEYCMTCNFTDVEWCRDINGQPRLAGPMNTYGFDKTEETYFFQSEFDLWAYDIDNKKLHCLTQRKGEKSQIRFDLRKWNYDSTFIDLHDVYVLAFDNSSKANHIYELYDDQDDFGLYEKFGGDFSLIGIQRSENHSHIIARKMSIGQYPEISLLDSNYQNEQVLSNSNPQQEEYNWATVEQVSWKTADSVELNGLIFLPEDFDSTKKYPMLVYFYEQSSDQMHDHLVPKPSSSIINPVEYASAGYIVFIPDIRYTHPGKPAKSAYNCVVSGTDYVCKKYPIDSMKIGLQGQSWGGYQTAQLITMTDKYAAAMAGAPVSNMFSAYGGIRWESGLNRQFQYECSQSRIGKTIWEAPELYFENSPLFHLPNVKTPLLIMHNDQDGAVPWYQGIELYNGMRRLQKPCWMLTYNNDGHNLTMNANRIDLSIRMRQFFDHYLKNKPMPIWMKYGIPAKEKETNRGYESED